MPATFGPFAPLLAEGVAPDTWAGAGQGVLALLALVVSSVGVAAIVWGVYSAALRLIAAEVGGSWPAPKADGPEARPPFTSYLLAGLEFLIAGCLIKTLAVPDWQQACVLASLVLARTLLGLGGKWEAEPGVVPRQGKVAVERPAPPATSPEALPGAPAALPGVPENTDLVAAPAGR
jgi:uncharacterized membrane protein